MSLPSKSSIGLTLKVKEQISITLKDVLPIWKTEPFLDLQKVRRRTESGYTTSVEPYRGAQTWIQFHKKNNSRPSIKELDELIRSVQPELLGYISYPGFQMRIQDAFTLTYFWCKVVSEFIEEGASYDDSIQRLFGQLDQFLRTKSARYEVLTLFSGLKLPKGVDKIILGPEIQIQKLSEEEISKLDSDDIYAETSYKIVSSSVTTALSIKTTVNVELQTSPIEQLSTSIQSIQEIISRVACCLSIITSGQVGIVASFTNIRPTILPYMQGPTMGSTTFRPYSRMELDEVACKEVPIIYQKLETNQRDEVRLAALRLVDAENRLSTIDSLLDSVIGLETLLNPMDFTELSFRVALNYAFLAEKKDQRKRYDHIKDIQKTRNRIVHGGLKLTGKDATIINEHSALAKQCLRDAISRILNDNAFDGTTKLDSDFWLDRIIPVNTEP